MTVIGYHASHEQHTPRELLLAVQLAEAVGFDAAMCSDHLAPWTRAQGESGFAWAWLGAALASTDLPIGVVTEAMPGRSPRRSPLAPKCRRVADGRCSCATMTS